MNNSYNEKGLTLVEVTAGIILISIVLLSFFSFFTNAANFNAKNNDSIMASNIVREEIVKFNETYDDKSLSILKEAFKKNAETVFENTYKNENGTISLKKHNKKENYIIEIVIAETPIKSKLEETNPTMKEKVKPMRPVKISVYQEEKLLSESYTYHIGVW